MDRVSPAKQDTWDIFSGNGKENFPEENFIQ